MMNIIGKRKILYTISGLLFAAGVGALLVFGLKPGIDFTGGSLIELQFQGERPAVAQIQETLAPLNLGNVIVQQAGETNTILKLRFVTEEEHQSVLAAVRGMVESVTSTTATSTAPAVVESSFQTIGSTISAQLRDRVIQSSIFIILAIVAFVAYAFRKVSQPVASWKYGVVAVIAMIHDVVITMGIFAVLGYLFHVEVDVAFVVAMLTVFGYSINDTIVVFDRIRENLVRRGSANFAETVNAAINQTWARSINTSVTTLIVLLCLFVLGGESIKYFSLALLIGIFLGTYSSIFVASALLVSWEEWRRKRV